MGLLQKSRQKIMVAQTRRLAMELEKDRHRRFYLEVEIRELLMDWIWGIKEKENSGMTFWLNN